MQKFLAILLFFQVSEGFSQVVDDPYKSDKIICLCVIGFGDRVPQPLGDGRTRYYEINVRNFIKKPYYSSTIKCSRDFYLFENEMRRVHSISNSRMFGACEVHNNDKSAYKGYYHFKNYLRNNIDDVD